MRWNLLPALMALLGLLLIPAGALCFDENLLPVSGPAKTPGMSIPASMAKSPSALPANPFEQKTQRRHDAASQARLMSPEERITQVQAGLLAYQAKLKQPVGSSWDLRYVNSTDAVEEFRQIAEANGTGFRIFWRDQLQTPAFMSGSDLLSGVEGTPGEDLSRARHFLESRRALLKVVDPLSEFEFHHREIDDDGRRAYRFVQFHRGLEIYAHDIIVRLDRSSRVTGFSGYYMPTPHLAELDPLWGEGSAVASAQAALQERDGKITTAEDATLMLYVHKGDLRLVWRVVMKSGLGYRKEVFVDARSGEFLNAISLIVCDAPAVGSGIDLGGTSRTLQLYQVGADYMMINTTKTMFDAAGSTLPNEGKGVIHILDARNGESDLYHVVSANANSWPAAANAVSAAYYGDIVYNYFLDRHSRTSLDGNGMSMNMVVNFKNGYNNAFWNGSLMIFGNGDGTDFSDLAGALDVTGHEMSHGVIEHTANLVYQFQPGALNEHFADVFGAAVEFYHRGGSGNWLMGEDVTTPAIPGDTLRDMEDPDGPLIAFDAQPAHMDQFQDLSIEQDNGGVHINSGIPNRAFYLASDPGSEVGGIGIDKTERIWYRALSQYLNRNSTFADFRVALGQAAADLYGQDSNEQIKVLAALDTVGIVEGGGGGTWDGELCAESRPGMAAVIDQTSGNIWAVDFPMTQSIQLTSNPLGYLAGRPSFSDNADYYSWIADSGDIWLAEAGGANAQALTTGGGWWSVALSPDGSLLAACPAAEENNIYVFEVASGEGYVYPLIAQTSQDDDVGNDIVYGEMMEFALMNNAILYDCLHRTDLQGQILEYWDMNVLNLEDGISLRIFPPLPVGESVGNPSFAQNSDYVFAYDHLASDGNVYTEAVNLQEGVVGVVTNNFQSLSYPTYYSDDSAIFYQYQDGDGNGSIWAVSVQDRIQGQGDDQQWLVEALVPVWFNIGNRCITSVLLSEFTGEWEGTNIELDWNVQDASALDSFKLLRSLDGGDLRICASDVPAAESDAPEGNFHFSDQVPYDAGRVDYHLVAVWPDGRQEDIGNLELAPGNSNGLPTRLALLRNIPNPFNPSTQIRFMLPEQARGTGVNLTLYDLRGRELCCLVDDEILDPGLHSRNWNGLDRNGNVAAAGNYLVRLEAADKISTQMITLVK